MDFQRLGSQNSQQKPPMGRSKLLMLVKSDEVKTTIGHGVGTKNLGQPLAAANSCSSLTDEMDAAAAVAADYVEVEDVHAQSSTELQNKYCEELKQLSSSVVRREDEEDKNKTKGFLKISVNFSYGVRELFK